MELMRIVRETIAATPHAVAIHCPGRAAIAWGEVADYARRLAHTLELQGLGPGARIGIMARNAPAPVMALIAAFAAGYCAVVINPHQASARLAADLARLDLAALLGMPAEFSDSVPGDCTLLDIHSLQILRRGPQIRSDDPSTILDYSTSGTTGLPKRVQFAGHTVLAAATNTAAMHQEIEGDAPVHDRPAILFYPIANISGLSFLLYMAAYRRPILLMEKFALAAWESAMSAFPQQVSYLPPAALRMIREAATPPAIFRGTRAIRSGAAPLELSLRDSIEASHGVPILSHYGAAEFCGSVTSMRLADYAQAQGAARNSVGRARAGFRLRIIAPESGTETPPGQAGILQVQADRLGPEWIGTTDLACIDSYGLLTLIGRADGAINRGGFKVQPDAVADILKAHPAVRDAAVIGMDDARLGQVPVAAVELRAGAVVDAASLREFARAHLLAYQVPVDIAILPGLPRTATMKIDRGALQDMLLDRSR